MAVFPKRGLTPFAQRLQAEHDQRRAEARAQLLEGIVAVLAPYFVITAALLVWGLLNGLIGGTPGMPGTH